MKLGRYRQTGKRWVVCGFAAAVLGVLGCGDLDGNIYLPFDKNVPADTQGVAEDTASDVVIETDADETSDLPPVGSDSNEKETEAPYDCGFEPWGTSCKSGNRIYNLTFTGVEAATKKSMEISFEKLHCAGYSSAVIVAGDADCTACPAWYRKVGAQIDNIHNARGVVIAISTDGLGAADLSDLDALEKTKTMQPDFATGSNPFVFPCRYEYTPSTMVVNLGTAEIMGKDGLTQLTMAQILEFVEEADE